MGILQVGVILFANFLWWGFSGWELSGGNHTSGNFLGGSFPRPKNRATNVMKKQVLLSVHFWGWGKEKQIIHFTEASTNNERV